jgi:hypothetical protein
MLRFVALAIGVVGAFNNGAGLSLDFGAMSQAKDVYFSYVIDALNSIQLPNLEFNNGHVSKNSFHVNLAPKGVKIEPSDSNSIILSVNDLTASFKSNDLLIKVWIITCDGTIDGAIKDMSVSVKLQMDQQTLPNGRKVPGIHVLDVSVDIPDKGLNLTVQGNKVAQVVDQIVTALLPQIKNLLKNELQKGLMKALAPTINKVVADQNGVTELYAGIDLDWQINAPPTITPSDLSFGIKGLMFPKN